MCNSKSPLIPSVDGFSPADVCGCCGAPALEKDVFEISEQIETSRYCHEWNVHDVEVLYSEALECYCSEACMRESLERVLDARGVSPFEEEDIANIMCVFCDEPVELEVPHRVWSMSSGVMLSDGTIEVSDSTVLAVACPACSNLKGKS